MGISIAIIVIIKMKQLADIIKNYTPLTTLEKAGQIVKSAYLSATDYHDGNHYGALTDLTGVAALTQMRRKMLQDPVGSWILENKPRITDDILEQLENNEQETFGKSYYNFMKKYDFKPSARPLVQFVPDLELAYVSQRYKEIHDFLHVLLLDEVNVHNELVVKWFEMIQLGLPSASMAVFVSPFLSNQLTLEETAKICRLANKYKFVMNVHFEKEFSKPIDVLRKELMS